MPNSVEVLLEVYEDMVEISLELEMFFHMFLLIMAFHLRLKRIS